MMQIQKKQIIQCLIFLVTLVFACASQRPQLSPATQRLLHLIESSAQKGDSLSVYSDVLMQYPINYLDSSPSIQAILHTDDQFDEKVFAGWIQEYQKPSAHLFVVKCPLYQLRKLAQLKHVQYVEVDSRINKMGSS